MKIIKDNFKDRKVNNLLKKHFLELREVSPKGSTHVLDIEGLQHKSIKFWSIWENNKLIGCGALKILSKHHGEFKSISKKNPNQNHQCRNRSWRFFFTS